LKKYIAYKGSAFTIEWYFDADGNSEVLNYFNAQSDVQQDRLLMLLKRMGDFGRISDITKFRNEGDKIFAFKPHPDRYLSFFYTGKKIIITNAFLKKTEKLPINEKETALKIKADYEKRVKDRTYYENNI